MSFLQLRTYKLDRNLSCVLAGVTTNAASSVSSTTATGNGSLDSVGSGSITEMGFVWSTNANPTTSDSKVSVSIVNGAYTGSITGLSGSTTYHYRAYAINECSTAYGADTTFATSAAGAFVPASLLLLLGVA